MSKMICIYHNNCVDGFGAAWVINRTFMDVDFFPGIYQSPPPDVTDKVVILVDFSYKRDVLIEMAAKAKSILIIDHHKSAIDDLVDLPDNVVTIFDMNHSGCILTWNYFFESIYPPTFLNHIEDRDLWLFNLPNTREIVSAIFSYPFEFDTWDSFHDIDRLKIEGSCLERKHQRDLDMLLKTSVRDGNIAGYIVPMVNCQPMFSSDAGNKLSEGSPLFAATYHDVKRERIFSLRSSPNGLDVSKIAEIYGGGGHVHAAGFKVRLENSLDFEISV
jgi:uncharacterized protein